MVLELHVWGPAFTLPSIDAHCLAAIAYFSQALPRGEWQLIASSPSLNPTCELPALKNDGIWIGGYANIIDYVKQLSKGAWDLDHDLTSYEKADITAFSAFLEARGQELLDLSLFVSSENYNAVTRPTFTKLTSFPLSWITPHRLRATSKARTAHLGLSSLDIDSDPSSPSEPSIIPESLQRKSTPSIISPESAAQIRLNALATSFLQPLQDLRSQKRFFIDEKPTSLDCLAIAYLALALYPDLPSPWLANAIRRDFPQLGAFVHDMQRLMFGGTCSLSDAGLAIPSGADMEREARARGKAGLPWVRAQQGGLWAIGGAVLGHVVENIPVVSDFVRAKKVQKMLEEEAEKDPEDAEQLALMHLSATRYRREILTSVATVGVGLGLFVAFLVKQGVVAAIAGDIKKRVQEVEEEEEEFNWGVGGAESVQPGIAALASQMDFLGDMQFGGLQPQNRTVAEVEVEGDVLPDRTL